MTLSLDLNALRNSSYLDPLYKPYSYKPEAKNECVIYPSAFASNPYRQNSTQLNTTLIRQIHLNPNNTAFRKMNKFTPCPDDYVSGRELGIENVDNMNMCYLKVPETNLHKYGLYSDYKTHQDYLKKSPFSVNVLNTPYTKRPKTSSTQYNNIDKKISFLVH